MNFTETQALAFKKLLKALKLTQKSLIEEANKTGYQLDATALSGALSGRRPLPVSYIRGIKSQLELAIQREHEADSAALQELLKLTFAPSPSSERSSTASTARNIENHIVNNTNQTLTINQRSKKQKADSQKTDKRKDEVFIEAGKPLPHNCAHYITRRVDTEVAESIKHERPLIFVVAAPKMGTTSLFNQLTDSLKSRKEKIVCVDMKTSWSHFHKAFNISSLQKSNEIILVCTLLYAIATYLSAEDSTAKKIDDILNLPPELAEHAKKQVAQTIKALLNNTNAYIFIDHLDKLLYEQKINFSEHQRFAIFLKDTLTDFTTRVICSLSPFVWSGDTQTSMFLRQAATCQAPPFDIHHVKLLHECLLSKNLSYAELEVALNDNNTVQTLTRYMGGNPFLIHLFLSQKENKTKLPSIDALKDTLLRLPNIQSFENELQQVGKVFEQLYTPFSLATIEAKSIEDMPTKHAKILESLGFIDTEWNQKTALIDLVLNKSSNAQNEATELQTKAHPTGVTFQ